MYVRCACALSTIASMIRVQSVLHVLSCTDFVPKSPNHISPVHSSPVLCLLLCHTSTYMWPNAIWILLRFPSFLFAHTSCELVRCCGSKELTRVGAVINTAYTVHVRAINGISLSKTDEEKKHTQHTHINWWSREAINEFNTIFRWIECRSLYTRMWSTCASVHNESAMAAIAAMEQRKQFNSQVLQLNEKVTGRALFVDIMFSTSCCLFQFQIIYS